jgi:hypothetical protein
MMDMPVILVLGRLRPEDHEFEVSLGYIARPYLKKKMQQNLLLLLIIIPQSRQRYCFHFADEETELNGAPKATEVVSSKAGLAKTSCGL